MTDDGNGKTAYESILPRHRVFVDEYISCWNATTAARNAKYKQPQSQGSRLLKNVEIQAAITERIAEIAMSADEVLLRLADHARGSISDCFVFVDGVKEPFVNLQEMKRRGKLHLIKKFVRDNTGKITIEIHDPQAALVHLGKHHGLFVDRKEISIPEPIQINDERHNRAISSLADAIGKSIPGASAEQDG